MTTKSVSTILSAASPPVLQQFLTAHATTPKKTSTALCALQQCEQEYLNFPPIGWRGQGVQQEFRNLYEPGSLRKIHWRTRLKHFLFSEGEAISMEGWFAVAGEEIIN